MSNDLSRAQRAQLLIDDSKGQSKSLGNLPTATGTDSQEQLADQGFDERFTQPRIF